MQPVCRSSHDSDLGDLLSRTIETLRRFVRFVRSCETTETGDYVLDHGQHIAVQMWRDVREPWRDSIALADKRNCGPAGLAGPIAPNDPGIWFPDDLRTGLQCIFDSLPMDQLERGLIARNTINRLDLLIGWLRQFRDAAAQQPELFESPAALSDPRFTARHE